MSYLLNESEISQTIQCNVKGWDLRFNGNSVLDDAGKAVAKSQLKKTLKMLEKNRKIKHEGDFTEATITHPSRWYCYKDCWLCKIMKEVQ